MNLHKLIFTESDCYKEGMAKKQFIKPIALMWHSTGANNPNLKRYVGPDDGLLGKNIYNNHWNQPRDRRVCYHAFVGKLKDDTIASYQVLPWDLRGWHSGSGKNGNANSLGYIGICICEDNLKDKAYAMAVYQEAVEFSAYICKLYGLDPLGKNRHGLPVVLDHASAHKLGIASNHGDVLHWFGRYGITLDKIRRDVWALLEPELTPAPEPAPKPKPKPSMDDKIKAWDKANTLKLGSKGKTVEVLQRALAGKGYNVVVIDGDFGSVTDREVRKYQTDNKLFVDGICGPQTWGGADEMIEFVDKVKPLIEMIAWVGTLITVITLLIVNRTKIKNWQDNRRERSRKLDDLISNATELQETHKMLAELIEAATRTTESVTTLAKTVEETIAHNKRQDAELKRSRNQRRVHDIALFALVDTAAQNGHDGAITEARKVMLEHLQEVAHEPVYKGEC